MPNASAFEESLSALQSMRNKRRGVMVSQPIASGTEFAKWYETTRLRLAAAFGEDDRLVSSFSSISWQPDGKRATLPEYGAAFGMAAARCEAILEEAIDRQATERLGTGDSPAERARATAELADKKKRRIVPLFKREPKSFRDWIMIGLIVAALAWAIPYAAGRLANEGTDNLVLSQVERYATASTACRERLSAVAGVAVGERIPGPDGVLQRAWDEAARSADVAATESGNLGEFSDYIDQVQEHTIIPSMCRDLVEVLPTTGTTDGTL